MRCVLLAAAFFCAVAPCRAAGTAAPQQSESYYLSHGVTLHVVQSDPTRADYSIWRVWLYPRDVQPSRFGAALPYARWGILQGSSARAVMEQVVALQKFERAYTAFFDANSWDRFTFLSPLGPIAVANAGVENESPDLLAEISLPTSRIGSVISALLPSLENGQQRDATPLVRAYADILVLGFSL